MIRLATFLGFAFGLLAMICAVILDEIKVVMPGFSSGGAYFLLAILGGVSFYVVIASLIFNWPQDQKEDHPHA